MDTWRPRGLTSLCGFLLLGTVAFLGCSDGGGGGGGVAEGTFNDAAVQGIQYVSGNQSGVTDANGTFFFQGDTVTFSIGGVVIGTGAPTSFMTPIDLVEGATDESDPTVTNICRFLQTLDDDGNPANGIMIAEETRAAFAGQTIDFGPDSFEDDWAALPSTLTDGVVLVSAEDAQSHFEATLLGALAGNYRGTFTGDDDGNFQIAVDASGNLTGTVTPLDSADPPFPITGNLTSDGAFSGSGTNTSGTATFETTFTGAVVFDGRIEGTWTSRGSDGSTRTGTFVGGEDAPPDGGGGGGDGDACDVEGLPGYVVRFVVTKEYDQGQQLANPVQKTLRICAAFECNGPADPCTLHVFDIAGGDRFFQYLTPLGTCFGFEARVADPDTGEIFDFSGQPNREFGIVPSETFGFATGTAQGSLGTQGTFEFFEFNQDQTGFQTFVPPNTACPGSFAE